MRPTVDQALDAMRNLSPSVLKMLAPLVEQLSPVLMDVSQGRQEFSPSPDEVTNLIRTYYSVSRNLLIRCGLALGVKGRKGWASPYQPSTPQVQGRRD